MYNCTVQEVLYSVYNYLANKCHAKFLSAINYLLEIKMSLR